MELLIMAAGMGSRFGGLKQITPMGPNEEFIIDYSIFDAIKAGFSKVIFIIKEENFEVFKETIGSRVEPHLPVEYVFQKMDTLPIELEVPEDRIKPWGTAQAIYCAKDKITENFVIINADDFYGRDAYTVAANFLKNAKPYEYANIAYRVKNTITENGAVKRGVLSVDLAGELEKITESNVERKDGVINASPIDGSTPFTIEDNHLVSMNIFALDKTIFPYLEKKIIEFFEKNKDNLEKCEYLIGDVLSDAAEEGYAKVKVLDTTATWHGVTYRQDAEEVKNAINKLIEEGEYPNHLWD